MAKQYQFITYAKFQGKVYKPRDIVSMKEVPSYLEKSVVALKKTKEKEEKVCDDGIDCKTC